MSDAPTPPITTLAAGIRAKIPMMAVIAAPDRTPSVETTIGDFANDPVGFVRVGNPLALPLSLDRLVLQITSDELDERLDSAERVLRALIARSETRRQVVVVVEQAETLVPEALNFLYGLQRLTHPRLALLQVALLGTEALRQQIAGKPTCLIAEPADALPAAATRLPAPSPHPTLPVAVDKAPSSRRFLFAAVGACAVVVLLIASYGSLRPKVIATASSPPTASGTQLPPPPVAERPQPAAMAEPAQPAAVDRPSQAPTAAVPTEPAPFVVEPLPTTGAIPPAPPGAASPLPEVSTSANGSAPETAASARARLYREFNAFIGSRGLGKRLSQTEREALFQEYLAQHQSPPPKPAARPVGADSERGLGGSHILLFFAAGSEPDHAAAEQEAALLSNRVAKLELMPASDIPARPTIRYAFAADRTAAFTLAQTTDVQGGEWQVEDVTADTGHHEPGTLEIWLPRR